LLVPFTYLKLDKFLNLPLHKENVLGLKNQVKEDIHMQMSQPTTLVSTRSSQNSRTGHIKTWFSGIKE